MRNTIVVGDYVKILNFKNGVLDFYSSPQYGQVTDIDTNSEKLYVIRMLADDNVITIHWGAIGLIEANVDLLRKIGFEENKSENGSVFILGKLKVATTYFIADLKPIITAVFPENTYYFRDVSSIQHPDDFGKYRKDGTFLSEKFEQENPSLHNYNDLISKIKEDMPEIDPEQILLDA